MSDGRDGQTLKEWLKQNKHVTRITRDRASAYATAIEEILPDAMQSADRFHLHQNLLAAMNKILGRELLATTAIPHKEEASIFAQESFENEEPPTREDSKKISSSVDNLSSGKKKCLQLIRQIQESHQQGIGIAEILRWTGKDIGTVKKYREG